MKRILIADDDASIQDTTRRILERKGYTVTTLPNGDTLLDDNLELPDLFILDKQLAGVDGLDICRYLKAQERSSHIPVIMLSASPHIMRLAAAAGADDALEKPFEMSALRNMVERLIKKRVAA